MSGTLQHPACWAAVVVVLLAVHRVRRWLRVDDGRLDAGTAQYLASDWTPRAAPLYDVCGEAPAAAEAMVRGLESSPFTDDEGACAAQMRALVRAAHIAYPSLTEAPEVLLRASAGHEGPNGALWTRFTVQFNLFAGFDAVWFPNGAFEVAF